MQLDLTISQELVTDNEFRDKDFRCQLKETVESQLALKVVPVFNENDAISTRKAPYEVCGASLLNCFMQIPFFSLVSLFMRIYCIKENATIIDCFS